MSHDYDLKDVVTELKAALKPLEPLAESIRGLDRSHRIQADLLVIAHYYSEQERENLYAKFDKAANADSVATETVLLSSRRSSDQRTFEQYAQVHGEEQAKKAFTSHEDAAALCTVAQQELAALKTAHPLLYRVHAYVRKN